MKTVFVGDLSNEVRFYNAVRAGENRGSAEASWILVEGDPGYCKSRTLSRYAAQNKCLFARSKAEWTSNSMLKALCDSLNIAGAQRTMAMLDAICGRLMELQPNAPNIVIDEINLVARKLSLIETLRDITDTTEVMLIAGGNKGSYAAFNRYPQIRSRIVALVPFGPLTEEDVRTVAKAISEVKIADDLLQEIRERNQGQMRAIRNMIARVEKSFRSSRDPVTLDAWGKRPLIPEHEVAALRLAVNNG
jgi:hypothetical protein